MTVNGHVLTGSRALGLIGDLTGHVITGSAAGRGLAAIPGHVITGVGHFIQGINYTIQEFPIAYNQADVALRSMQDWANNLQANLARPILIPTSSIQRSIMLLGNPESSAWDAYMENGGRQTLDSLKELGLSLGSAFSGDVQGAIEHGMAYIEQNQQDLRHMRDVMAERAAGRSGEGIIRDMGMIRHAGD